MTTDASFMETRSGDTPAYAHPVRLVHMPSLGDPAAAANELAHGSDAQRIATLELLYTSLRRILGAADPLAALASVAREAASAIGAKDCVVTYRNGNDLDSLTASDGVRPVATPLGRAAFCDEDAAQLPSVRAILNGSRIVIEDVRTYDGPPAFQEACATVGIRAVLIEPLTTPSGTAAALNLGFSRPTTPTASQLSLAVIFAEQAAIALDLAFASLRERELQSRLRALDELHADFLGTVSHELRTPLTGIQGFSETLTARWDEMDDALRRDLTARIGREAVQLDGLVDELLDYSKLERGAVQLDLQPLDLGIHVRRIVGKLQFALARHRIEIDVPTGLIAMAAPDACGRVLGNLLGNAAKFSPHGSRIRVVAVPSDTDVLVRVEDEGIGIPPDERERVFERFYRVDRGDRAARGTGIGLAVVRQYVQSSGGAVWIESMPGGGTALCVSFPIEPRSGGDSPDAVA